MPPRVLAKGQNPAGAIIVNDIIVIEGMAMKHGKHQRGKQRFMFEGPRPYTIFCFALIHFAWIT